MQIQQGDVIGRMVGAVPENAKAVKPVRGRLIVAEGEATGHAHAIQADSGAALVEADGKLYLSVEQDTPMTHEEHNPVTWAPGIWEIGKVREKDWFEDAVRPVFD
jgi:hypothetical protein